MSSDLYGQSHPNETPELIKLKLKELDEELEKDSVDSKAAYEQAKVKCPEQLTPKFKLEFLRCEVFNVDLAAKRLIRYWKKRLEVFGPDRAFLPLTLTQALVEDEETLKIGFARLVEGTLDPIGRGVMFVDPSKLDKTKYSRESMVRAMWYTIHAALEVESTQRYGLVALSFTRNATFSQFDRELVKMIVESLKGYLPVRLSAIHICHPPSFLRLIFPIMKMFLGERLRKRVRVHGGSEHQVLNLLAGFGLLKEMLPVDIGGNKVLDQEKWLQARNAEGK